MQLNVQLKYATYHRSFFVTFEEDKTFKWLAKVVFHRYTIFVPALDKPNPHSSSFSSSSSPHEEDMTANNTTFSPPIDGVISDYVKGEGESVTCCLDNVSPDQIKIKFFLKYTGIISGCTYVLLSAKKQEELRAEFKTNRYHSFQRENQAKLAAYISTHISNPTNATGKNKETGANGSTTSPPPMILQPRPPSCESYRAQFVSTRFRRRLKEKEELRDNCKPLYDFDPQDIEFSIESDSTFSGEDDEGTFRRKKSSLNRRRGSVGTTSRQLAFQLRMSKGLFPETQRKTEIRKTVANMLKKRAEEEEGIEEVDMLDKNNDINRGGDESRYFIKPNGPMSKDVLWRQRVLGFDMTSASNSVATASSNLTS